ncbi:protein SERAC1 [Phthorimaea operculella]|nr:protein SERAC1 [Phthorimaea operculella]
MSLLDKLRIIKSRLKALLYVSCSAYIISYNINQTRKTINKIVNTSVLDCEKKSVPEYIYIDDPSYPTLMMQQDKECKNSLGLVGFVKSLKHSVTWRLLWLCKYGNIEQRNIALDRLANFKNNKHWDCLKLAQAMDKQTALLLARTRGADLRYFLPPPIHVRRAALTDQLVSFKLRDMVHAIQMIHPHSCIEHFLRKYFTNVQEQAMEADSIPAKPDSISEHDLCLHSLDAIHHHLSLYYEQDYDNDLSTHALVQLGLIPTLAEILLRYRGDNEMDYAVLRILTVLSVHCNLGKEIFENGLVGELCRLLKVKDVRLASSAAVTLTNLSGEHCYRPGLYLLHPVYRTRAAPDCDVMLVHGLRGGVFVTWRQRDRKCAQPVGLIEATISDTEGDNSESKSNIHQFLDPELTQVLEDLKELDEESLLSDFEVVLHDIPTEAAREHINENYTALNRYSALLQENQDRCRYTHCWPKDWLPMDCDNLRIVGVNYWSSLSEWLERCPLQTAEISVRAEELAPSLLDAGVGRETPVVWLAHSMGGLIVKQMLIEAAKSKDILMQKLCENTKALVFYSTPHKGSAMATMPRTAAAILWPSNDVRQLQENSPVLLKLHDEFLAYSEIYKWETISFVESLPTLVTAFKVPINFVQATSADIGSGVLYKLPLDHLSICKPATRQSILYTSVTDVINRVTSKNIELRYSNPFVRWLINLLSLIFNIKTRHVVDKVDDDNLKWFEQVLLDTFTDF